MLGLVVDIHPMILHTCHFLAAVADRPVSLGVPIFEAEPRMPNEETYDSSVDKSVKGQRSVKNAVSMSDLSNEEL